MPDLLASGAAWISGRLKTHASKTVTYRRGIDEVELLASVGNTEFEIETEDGADLERWQSRDFLIAAADLVLAGQTVLPEKGDTIKETVGDATHVYEVMAPGDVPHFRYSDAHRVRLRIHTKQVEILS